MWLLLMRAHAQDTLPPPINATDTCGQLCDFVMPIAFGTPAVSLFVVLFSIIALHVTRTNAAAAQWSGARISWFDIWLLPLLAGSTLWIFINLIPLFLAFSYPDFWTLLMNEASHIGYGLWLILTGLLGVCGPPFVSFLSGRPSSET